jgi:hypothetical protein
MKKLIVLAAAVAGLLALSAPAQAKEIISMKICGASGCVTSTDQSVLKGWEGDGNDPAQIWQTNPADYYMVTIGFGDQGKLIHTDTANWLPGRNLMRFQGQYGYPWWKLSPSQVRMLRSVAGNITAFTPGLSRVRIGGKPVADPGSYLRLLGKLHEVYLPVNAPRKHRLRVMLHTDAANPWIRNTIRTWYRPKTRILVRNDGAFRVPKRMARRVLRRVSLAGSAPAAVSHADSTALYAGIGAAGLAAAVGLVLVGGAVRKARDS